MKYFIVAFAAPLLVILLWIVLIGARGHHRNGYSTDPRRPNGPPSQWRGRHDR